jgi:hypothetical protein
LCGAIAGAAGTLGYKAHQTGKKLAAKDTNEANTEISLADSKIIAESMKRDSEFSITRDNVVATFRRTADGRCSVHLTGKDKTEEELQAIGQELVGRVTQQYAYNKVVTDLKKRGFTVTNEEVAADQTIRISVSKYV